MANKFKLTDVQNVTLEIVGAGSLVTQKSVTHGLKDENGAFVNPDEIHAELISGAGAGVDLCLRLRFTRPGVANGTFLIDGDSDTAAGGGVTWTYVYKVTSKYYHSVQSKDHTA